MEALVSGAAPSLARAFSGKRVLVTGHTGFKGAWLTLWLNRLGAEVHGVALDPPTQPNLFECAELEYVLASDTRADVASLPGLERAISKADPEILFHLAAQPLVRTSYLDPLITLSTNVMGTANVLDCARRACSLRTIVIITTDKVYDNREWSHPYRESDSLGGRDPYSASKAAAEIIASSYRDSFFSGPNGHPARVATARAGNVIGGGDWAADRLTPDCLKAFASGNPVSLRFPHSVRPWQHVLEPLSGYLRLAHALSSESGSRYARAFNFGPDTEGDATVGTVARTTAELWGADARVEVSPSDEHPHEAGLLRLDSTLARIELGWRPKWNLREALSRTTDWHKAWCQGANMREFSTDQIAEWESFPGR